MRAPLLLVIVLIWSQEIQSKEISDVFGVLHYELASIKYGHQERSLADIWGSIKNAANQAWESIKKLANNTRRKFADWIQKIKIKAQDVRKSFEERLQDMKDRINVLINNIKETGEVVKQCLQERKEAIDEVLKNILLDVTNCLSSSLAYLKELEEHNEPVLDETEFLKKAEDELRQCLTKDDVNDNIEECCRDVRGRIYEKMEITETDILQNHIEVKSASDDVLGTIINCTTNGIIKASAIIANETINIVHCVTKGQQ